jgi:hypothetical protein
MTQTKLIPFDLSRALAGDKVVTRDGREAQEIHQFKNIDNEVCVFAIIQGILHGYEKNGKHAYFDDDDLFIAPKVKMYWVNVYKYRSEILVYPNWHETEEEAKRNIFSGDRQRHIKTISFEVDE